MPPTDRTEPAAPHRAAFAGLALVLAALAWWLRSGPLGPGSLWLDDLWVVAPSQAEGLDDALRMLVTTPVFTVVVNLLYAVAGPSSIAAQTVPFAAGVAGPVVAVAAARTMGWRWPAGVVTGMVVAVAPEHVVQSTRVKQYTVEAALGFVVVALAWRVAQRRGSPWPLVALAAGATTVSASAGVFAGAALGAAAAVAVWTAEDRRGALRIVAPAVGTFAGFALLWWAVYLRGHVPDGLREYWRADFLRTDDVAGYVADLGAALDRLAAGALPLPPAWLWLAVAAAVVAVRNPRLGLVLAAPVAAAVALATLQLAPLGTGRTDVYLLPSIALALGAAVEAVDVPGRRWAPAVAALAAVLLFGAFAVRDLRPSTYPQHDVRPLIAAAERDLGAGGRIVVYPATRWAWAVYGSGGFEPVDADNETGFEVEIATPGVEVLRPHREHPERYLPELEAATVGIDEVTFVASHWRSDITVIESWFADHGWVEVRRVVRPGARLVVWRR